jgi:hypothetical protein
MKEAHVVNETFKIKIANENEIGKRRKTVMMPKEVRIADKNKKLNDSEEW